MHNKIPKICTGCRVSAAKIYLYHSTEIAKARPHTLMPVYHCHKPVLWSKWPLASSLLQAIKTCRQACPPGYLMHFS